MTKVANIRYCKEGVYIGRAGKGESGYFGNPHIIGYCKLCNKTHDREECILEYKKYFYERLQNDPIFKQNILKLKNKTLLCFCVDKEGKGQCHGILIAQYLDNNEQITQDKENQELI